MDATSHSLADTTDARYGAIDWSAWTPGERATLLFIIRDRQVLLIEKQRGLGAGKINGPGGRIEDGEKAEEAAVREVEEEIHVTPTGVRHCGELSFQFTSGFSMHVTVYRADDCVGTPQASDEAIPLWASLDEVPFKRMWADDRTWFHLMLDDTPFHGRYLFEDDRMLGYEISLG